MNRSHAAKPSLVARRHVVPGVLALAAFAILSRAVHLQLVQDDFLRGQGDKRHHRVVEVPADRGMIVDRNGEPLAVSSPVDSVWADPAEFLAATTQWPELARVLGTTVDHIAQRVEEHRKRRFVYLRRHLAPHVAQRVMAMGIPGVHLQREYRRFYPAAEVTSQLLGFTDIDHQAQGGIELAFDGHLRGVPGKKRVIKDRRGRIVEGVERIRAPQPGKRLVLSIDRRIQYLAYKALKSAMVKHDASTATAVLLDVATGEVLAMVNEPAGNPNVRDDLASDLLRNRAVTDPYEPGSTLKPFTALLALESGRYQPRTAVDVRPGYLRVGRNIVRDVHNYGRIDLAQVISKSSNVGISKIALSMPRDRLWSMFKKLGFGSPTGIGYPGEASGVLSHHSSWSDFEYATHSFGYGISVTPLQLAQAYAVLAAEGIRRPLSLLRRESAPQGTRVFSVSSARKVRAMLEDAVSRKGTGFKANVPGNRVAGKTGTVHKLVDGRYSPRHYYSLFAGMAPASRPRLALVVIIDDAKKGKYYGGQVAAPVFSAIMSGALSILNVTPDAIPGPRIDVALNPGASP